MKTFTSVKQLGNLKEAFAYAINPCGFVDKGVTSIARELGSPVPFADVQTRLRSALEETLQIHTVSLPCQW